MNNRFTLNIPILLFILLGLFFNEARAQETTQKPSFWSNVRFGGNLSLSFANKRTSIVVAPSAIYQFNQKFSAGIGINFGYNNGLNFEDYIYGGSLIFIYTPIPGLQFSAEIEETGVSRTIETPNDSLKNSYFYPSLFLGVGYQVKGITIGMRYDILYNDNKSIYASPFNPFFRVFF